MKQVLGIAALAAALLALPGMLGAMEQPHSAFTVPWFEVGPVTGVPGGTTTVFAVTNVGGSAATVNITYFNLFGIELEIESVGLAPNQTFTRNVPDFLPPPAGGVLRGYIEITGDSWLAVDYFQIGPRAAFATGDRALPTYSEGNCHEVELRFLNGAPGGGGEPFSTDFIFYFAGKTRSARTYQIDFYDEPGNLLESRTWPGTRARVRRLDMSSFPVSAPFGTMRVRFPNGGAVVARIRTSQYAASIKGVCLD